MRVILFLIFFILNLVTCAFGQENELSMAELQKKYSGKRVIVKTLFVRNGKQFDWNEAKQNGDYYVYDALKYIPVTYIGREAEIIAIQLNKKEREEITEIPDYMTQEEINAIKLGAVFKSMSVAALHFSIGFPDKEKESSGGGNQLIYNDWLNIILDNQNDHIISCQIIDSDNERH